MQPMQPPRLLSLPPRMFGTVGDVKIADQWRTNGRGPRRVQVGGRASGHRTEVERQDQKIVKKEMKMKSNQNMR